MKRILITSLRFSGQAEAIYNDDGVLVKLDATGCTIDTANMALLKGRTPSDISKFEQGWKDMDAIVLEAELIVTLQDFKREYAYSRNSHLLQPIWDKMTKVDQIQAVEQAIEYRKYCLRNKHWYNPKIAASWLREKQYLNNWKIL